MIHSLSLQDFTAVAHLSSSLLMQHHPEGLMFSLDRPNVIVGPNGSGKSALLTTLAIRFLAYFTGESCLDSHYLDCGTKSASWWSEKARWLREYTFLEGLNCETDNALAIYYRPRHVPGNEASSTHALMMGYAAEARTYQAATDKRSCGEANRARLEAALAVAQGTRALTLQQTNWNFGLEARDLRASSHWVGDRDYKAEVLKTMFRTPGERALVMFDEPEQSLDLLEATKFWRRIEAATGAQVLIASHSLYPLLHRERFNIIETVPGYVPTVLAHTGSQQFTV